MPRPPRLLAKAVAGPMLDRVAARLAASSEHDATALRAEIAELRAEVARLQTDMEAELALLRAELTPAPPFSTQ